MQVTQPFEIDVISVKDIFCQSPVNGREEIPANVIFGTFSTKSRHAYVPENGPVLRRWHFEAVMANHPEKNCRYFVRIGVGDGPDFVRNIVAEHLKKLKLTGACDTFLSEKDIGL